MSDLINKSVVCPLAEAFVWIGGAIATVVFVYAGVLWVYSMDDAGARKKAKDMMMGVIVGLIIIGLAHVLVKGIAPTVVFPASCP